MILYSVYATFLTKLFLSEMEGFRVLEATILHAMVNGVMNVLSGQIDMVSFGALSHAGFEDVGDAFGGDKRVAHAISIDLLFCLN